MPPAIFRISVDLSDLMPDRMPLNKEAMPELAFAVQKLAAATHERWANFARGVPLPSGKVINNRTGEYLRSILLRTTGDFAAEVYSELPYAKAIEEGTPARDMKTMLNSSLKVRLTKDGRRYLIIPFRHDTPGTAGGQMNMPAEVHRWWKQEGRIYTTQVAGPPRLSGTGAYDIKTRQRIMVPGWRYLKHTGGDATPGWGTRLGKADLVGMGFGANDKVTKRLQGMVNFRKPNSSGGASNSQYITFRVMMEGSPGWMAPARAGLFPAKAASDEANMVAEEMFREAAEGDIRALLLAGGGAKI